MTPEQKLVLKEGKEKAKLEKAKQFVSADDFNNFKTSVVGILEDISNKMNSTPERKVMTATEPEKVTQGSVSHAPSNQEVVHNLQNASSEYETIFEKYFDPEDEFKAMIKGVNFTLEVPMKLSNASDAHKTFYKRDIRHKVLDPHDIEGSMERYCKLVCQNLNYKRNVRLKI